MLRIWLPLTKDLRNQGLADVTVTNNGATFNSAGKLGGCYSFDGSDDFISLNSSILYDVIKGGSNPFSIAMWIYRADSTRAILFGDYSLSGSIGFNIELNANHSMRFYWNGTPDTSGSHTLATLNTWTHLTITYDGTRICFYTNGTLTDTYTVTLTTKTKTSGMYYLGRDSRTGSTALNGKMNDFRIYDHCLSPMEVKRIAQGLILHYPLDNNGWGQDNQFKNSNFTNGTNSWYGVNSSSIRVETKDGRLCGTGTKGTTQNIIGQTGAAYTGNTTVNFTISAKIYVNEAGTINIGNWITTTQASGWQSISGTRIWNTSNNLSVGWNYVSTTLKNATNQYTGNIVTAFGYSGSTFWITDVKFEFGDKATPWCPHVEDALATAMGFNDNIEYDTSGFGNNGTRVGDFSWSTDTPKYLASTTFNGNNGIFTHLAITLSHFTIAFWGKHSVKGKMLIGSNVSLTNTNGNWYWYGDNSFKYPNGEYYYQHNAGSIDSLLGKWTHFVATYNGEELTIYRNGINEGSQAVTGSKLLDYLSIGVGLSSSYWANGDVSDVRIYATALSADDILSLYQASAYIDSQGNTFASLYVEG